MDAVWKQLYDAAVSVAHSHKLSDAMSVGDTGAAVLSKNGNIYTGICIDTYCGLGFCAERNALTNMFTAGDYEVAKICTVLEGGKIVPPCGACTEYLLQMGEGSKDVEILIDGDGTVIGLKDLAPYAW